MRSVLYSKIFLLLLCCTCSMGQRPPAIRHISFQHLNTTNGLSYLGVNDMCTDKKGNLWIATGNGLNTFNGKTVFKYYAAEYPQLQNNNIVHVTCDELDQVWILMSGGHIAMLDEKRQMHRVGLYDQGRYLKTRWILHAKGGGIMLFTWNGTYAYDSRRSFSAKDSLSMEQFRLIPIRGFDSLGSKGFNQIFRFTDGRYLLNRDSGFVEVNYTGGTVSPLRAFPNRRLLVDWSDHELLAFNRNSWKLELIDLGTGNITDPLAGCVDQFGKPLYGDLNYATWISPDEILMTSLYSGIYILNRRTHTLVHYVHNIADPASLLNNSGSTITTDNHGWVFINCEPDGICYFNNEDVIGNQVVFEDGRGRGYDGNISGIATQDNNLYYLGILGGLMEWNRNTNEVNFLDHLKPDGSSVFKNQRESAVLIDRFGHIWVTTLRDGIIIFNRERKMIKQIKSNGGGLNAVRQKTVTGLINGPDGSIWACGYTGICRIDPQTYAVENFEQTPLTALWDKFCGPILFTDKNNLWIATKDSGVFHYDFLTKQMTAYNTRNGLISNEIFAINCDKDKNIYIGTMLGLNILFRDGRIKTITDKNGLLVPRAEGLLPDRKNRMWIGNDIGLVCYDPTDSSTTAFDVSYGLSIYGFRVSAYYQNSNGEFVFGTPRGLQYFYPDDLFSKKIKLNALITRIETREISSNITDNANFNLSPADNQVTFYFNTVNYTWQLRTYYEYQLSGIDRDWISISDQNSVHYNSLAPGTYTFRVRVSNNGKSWKEAANNVTITVAKRLWQQWWFKLLGGLAGILMILYVIRYYRKKQIRQHEDLLNQQKITESRLQNLRLQMNPHFLFNALNSIQQMILAKEDLVATHYLSRFSKLLRLILIQSDKELITLKEETEILNLYVELESVRFRNSFHYSIECDEAIEAEEVKIPALLIQPFVENAIWHGLMHKESDRRLLIRFNECSDGICCVIEDNGIGRKKAAEMKLKSSTDKKYRSKGIDVSLERIRSLTNAEGQKGGLQIEDLYDEDGEPAGTRVIITIPQ